MLVDSRPRVEFTRMRVESTPTRVEYTPTTEKTNNSFDKSVSSISVLREDNPQKTQSSDSLFKRNSESY
jgi:hypothetical protein